MPWIIRARVCWPVFATDACDDGHERGESHDLLDGALELADDAGGDEGGKQVECDPRPASASRLPRAREQVLVLAETHRGKHVLVGCLAQVVEHVIHLEAAHQLLVGVDHRGDDQVIALE